MFGDYEIIETVGSGGMGIVYRAHDTKLDRVVALKVLKDDLRSHKQVSARFQREAEAFASLNHPNIVHIYAVGAVGKIPFIAMEFIEGGPLSNIMRIETRIPWKRALYIVEQISNALACAHEAHIIHRDIKPANILVGKDDHAYVTDFGIAKVLTAETQLTVAGSRLGTPQYMSPERCMNKEITASSDIYSLGVLMFQMITGRLPYEASTPVELIKRIVTDAPKRVSEYRTDIPADVEYLVAHTIEKKPRDRPESGEALAEMIARVREGKPLKKAGSGVAESIESFRDSMATPTPSAERKKRQKTIPQKLARRWRRLSVAARLSTVGSLTIAIALLAGFGLADVLNRGYAVDAVREMNRSLEPWNRASAPSMFMEESPGVYLAEIDMPMYGVRHAAFLDDDRVGVQVYSATGRSGESLSALATIDLRTRRSWVSISPKHSDTSATAFNFLGMAPRSPQPNAGILYGRSVTLEAGMTEPGVLAAEIEGGSDRVIMRASDLAQLKGVAVPRRIGPTALAASGAAFFAAVTPEGGRNDWSLVKVWPGTEDGAARTQVVAGPGPEIPWIAARSDGTVRYARVPDAGSFELWNVSEAAGPESATLSSSGRGRLTASGLDPRGRFLAVLAARGGVTSVQLLDTMSSAEAIDIGPAESVAWHPMGRHLIVTAADRKGNLQLWAVRVAGAYERVQLTHFSSGTTDLCLISPGGSWTVSALRNQASPVLVFADVSDARLAALKF